MAENTDVCRVLGVRPSSLRLMRATDLRDIYIKEAAKHHPDKGGDPTAFGKVHSSYKILTSLIQRKLFLNRTVACAGCAGTGQVTERKGLRSTKSYCTQCEGYGYTEVKDVVVK